MHHNYFIQNNYYKFLFLLLGNLIFFCNDGISGIISFREEEITVTYDDIQISGTLSIPSGEGPFPTLIIISGSGPQNRDWDFDHNGEYLMGRIMANDLAQHGIAMFRYDDRGTGKSTGEGEDIRQLTEDVLHIMQHLKKNPSIGKIGLCGHSLGAEVALHAAVDNAQVNFLILLSSPFITGKDIMLSQAQEMPEMYRSSKDQTKEEASRDGIEFVQHITGDHQNEQNRMKAIAIFKKIFRYQISTMKDEERKELGDIEKRIDEDAKNLVNHYLSPESQFFLQYNPVSDLKKVICPVVALFGEGDQHVKISVNLKPLLHGLAEFTPHDFTLKIVPKINHFYTCPPYRTKGDMYPGVTEFISRWVINTTEIKQ